MRIPFLVKCGQLNPLSNQIARFFDCQYMWKESTAILAFLHGDILQGTVASETTFFGWVRLVVPLVQSDCMILWSLISPQGFNQFFKLFAWRWLSREANICYYHFGWGWPDVTLVQSNYRIL